MLMRDSLNIMPSQGGQEIRRTALENTGLLPELKHSHYLDPAHLHVAVVYKHDLVLVHHATLFSEHLRTGVKIYKTIHCDHSLTPIIIR